MNNDLSFMEEAFLEARVAYDNYEVPVGCVIVSGNKIIARSHNQKEEMKNGLYHAEMIAINDAMIKLGTKVLDEATIYITLEPCLMCSGAIMNARIKRVVFGASEAKFGALGSIIDISKEDKFNHKLVVESGLMKEEISALMKDFFKKLRLK